MITRTTTNRRRRTLFVAATLAAAVVGFAVSCTFPEVTFAPAGVGEGGSTDGPTSDVSDDVRVLVDGADPGEQIVKDAGKPIDPGTCEAGDCDCDDDTYPDFSKVGCAPDAGVDAGPTDCDDFDSRTHPNQGPLEDPAVPPRNGDWNCRNGVEKFYTPNLDCTKLAAGSACDTAFGFEDNPACGAKGTYVTCKTVTDIVFSKCAVGGKSLDKIQACK